MRLVEQVRSSVDRVYDDLYRRVLRFQNRHVRDEHVQPGHTYRDVLTGEEITIESVGPQVSVRRHDADARKEWSVSKDDAQLALDVGLLDHDQRRCDACPRVV